LLSLHTANPQHLLLTPFLYACIVQAVKPWQTAGASRYLDNFVAAAGAVSCQHLGRHHQQPSCHDDSGTHCKHCLAAEALLQDTTYQGP
jgi:hypothetical protein